jgi:hypothetical protein
METVAQRIEDVTPDWLTDALESAGHTFTATAERSGVISTGQMDRRIACCSPTKAVRD